MAAYRKKPIIIEAFQMTEARRSDNSDWPDWLDKAWSAEGVPALYIDYSDPTHQHLCIGTLEGELKVAWNDWIIQDANGALSLCNPVVFKATYEPCAPAT